MLSLLEVRGYEMFYGGRIGAPMDWDDLVVT
jgi:hypothetical protein